MPAEVYIAKENAYSKTQTNAVALSVASPNTYANHKEPSTANKYRKHKIKFRENSVLVVQLLANKHTALHQEWSISYD